MTTFLSADRYIGNSFRYLSNYSSIFLKIFGRFSVLVCTLVCTSLYLIRSWANSHSEKATKIWNYLKASKKFEDFIIFKWPSQKSKLLFVPASLPLPQLRWFSFKLVMEIKIFMIMIKQKLRWKAWRMRSSDSF